MSKLPRITQVKNERLRYDGHLLHFSAAFLTTTATLPSLWSTSTCGTGKLRRSHELYQNGQWTWETLERIAQRATRDTDGDGVIDQWGFAWLDPAT